jgi:hypothetical protein
MALFQKGQPKIGGRVKGVKNRLSHAFITALVEDFEQHGIEAIRICRVEKPNEYLRVVASLMLREIEFTDNTLADISDDQLFQYLEYARRELEQRSRSLTGGTEETLN